MKWYGYLGILIMIVGLVVGWWGPAAFGPLSLPWLFVFILVLPFMCGSGGMILILGARK